MIQRSDFGSWAAIHEHHYFIHKGCTQFHVPGHSTRSCINIIWFYCIALSLPSAMGKVGHSLYFFIRIDISISFVASFCCSPLFFLPFFSLSVPPSFSCITNLIITFWRPQNQHWRFDNATTCSSTNDRFKRKTRTCESCTACQSPTEWRKKIHSGENSKLRVPLMCVHGVSLWIYITWSASRITTPDDEQNRHSIAKGQEKVKSKRIIRYYW